jgi:dCTP deaminase
MNHADYPQSSYGALSSTLLHQYRQAGWLGEIPEGNIKPASLDLTVSDEVYEIDALYTPRKVGNVADMLREAKAKRHAFSKLFRSGNTYLAKLTQDVRLPEGINGHANPKSTTGRLDIHTRMLANSVPYFDSLPAGYCGSLWASIVPQSFDSIMPSGFSLNQLRLASSGRAMSRVELGAALENDALLWSSVGKKYGHDNIKIWHGDDNIILTLEGGLSPNFKGIVGWEAQDTDEVIDLTKVGHYDAKPFWKPVRVKNGYVYLEPGKFYILSTAEFVRVPPWLACEMLPITEIFGDFRSHYAGFIDPGWGWGKDGEGCGRPITLEVRNLGRRLAIRHHQPIAKIRFEKVIVPSEFHYEHQLTKSSYADQLGARLPKQFKQIVF